jgi:uncharacterized protein YndB with AHSA1/START domain
MTDLSLSTARVIAAPAQKIFDAWLDPKMIAQFMCPGPGVTVPRVETDPREGGRFDIVMAAGENEIPHWGIYKEISPHDRLVFTWQSPFSVEDSTVTLTLSAVEGGTEVRLDHVKFASEEVRDNHHGGWTSILTHLAQTLED